MLGRRRFSWKFLLDELGESSGLRGRESVLAVLGVGAKRWDLAVGNDGVLDDAGAVAFAPTHLRPENFAEAFGFGNQVTLSRNRACRSQKMEGVASSFAKASSYARRDAAGRGLRAYGLEWGEGEECSRGPIGCGGGDVSVHRACQAGVDKWFEDKLFKNLIND